MPYGCKNLLIDTQVITLYNKFHTYPMQGHACYNFFRDCEYLGLCTLKTENIVKPLTQEMLDKIEEDDKQYDFTIDFYQLVESQIEKGTN